MGLCNERFAAEIIEQARVAAGPVVDDGGQMLIGFRRKIGPGFFSVGPFDIYIAVKLFFVWIIVKARLAIFLPDIYARSVL